MNRKIVLSILTAGLLIGCGGGGGGGGSSSPSTRAISGNVVNGPIEGGIVYLQCPSKSYNMSTNTQTDENGGFIISNISNSEDLSKCTLIAKRGKDTTDGTDFSDLVLKAPYALLNQQNGIRITPITTLIENSNSSNIEDAKKEVADFLGADISVEDLTKDHLTVAKLKKKVKELTMIAQKRNSSDELIGYIDIDGTNSNPKNYSDINDYITQSDIVDKDTLTDEIDAIENAENLEEIIRKPIIVSTYKLLKDFYNISSANNENLKYLSELLTDSLKTTNDGEVTFQQISRYHVRKALSDISLYPKFKEDGSLTDEITNTLNGDLDSFKTFLNDKKIDITKIEGITIYDSSNYSQILGNNNDARVDYYMFSDKSPIAKAESLIKNTFDDNTLNPSYVSISRGFARAGLYPEAINVLNENIYGDYEKVVAYNNLARTFITDNQLEKAEEILDKSFHNIKTYTERKGAENLDSDDIFAYLYIFNLYYAINEKVKGENVITYFQKEVVSKLDNITAYGRLAVSYRNLIHDLIDDNKVEDAKLLFGKAVEYVKSIPQKEDELRTLVTNILFIAHVGPILKETAKTNELLQHIESIDAKFNKGYAQISSAGYTGDIKDYALYAGTIAPIRALNGDLALVEEKLKNGGIKSNDDRFGFTLKGDKEETALETGIAAAYFIANKNQEGLDLIYEYRPFKDYEGGNFNLGNQIFRKYAPRKIVASLDTPRILKAYDITIMTKYFEDLINDMETRPWTISDKAIANYVVDIDYGLPIIAKHYHSVNEIAKRDAIITKSINLANTVTDEVFKLSAYQAIIEIVNELGIEKTAEITTLVNNIKTLVEKTTLDNESADYITRLRYVVELSKNLAKFASLEDAQTLANTALDSLADNEAGNLEKINNRVNHAIGRIDSQDNDFFNTSILSALIETKQPVKAEKLIDDIQSNILTLGENSVDSYSLLRNVVRAYASIGNIEKVNSTLLKIKTFKEKNEAILKAVNFFSNSDSFVKTSFAFVDSDSDGKPDFFKKGSTAAQIASTELTLDEDIDGDGILDTVDTLPYSKEN